MRRGAVAALVVVVTGAVFIRTVTHGFLLWDDRELIVQNPLLVRPSARGLAALWTTPLLDLYVPLTCTIWMLLSALVGVTPWVFHLANVVLHALNAAAVYALLRLLPGVGRGAALAGALLFGVHPVQTETVAWASETKDLLSALLSLVAMRQYLVFRERGSRGAYGWASVAFACALFAKPSAVIAPALLVVLNRVAYGRGWRESIRGLVPWMVVAATFTLLFTHLQPAVQDRYVAPPWLRPLVALDSLGFYGWKILFPVPLVPDYGRTTAGLVGSGMLAYAWIPAALVLGGAWTMRHTFPAFALAVALFVVALLPVLGFVRFDFQYYSNVADHYLYLPMLGPATGVAIGWRTLPALVRVGAAPLVLTMLFTLSVIQASYWKDDATLYARTLAVNPLSLMAHLNAGRMFEERGQLDAALTAYRGGLSAYPRDTSLLNNIGWVLYEKGDYEGAIRHYRDVLAHSQVVTKGTARIHNNLGVAYMKTHRYGDALPEFERAVAVDPGFIDAYYNVGLALMNLGRYAEAVAILQKGLALSPHNAVLRRQLDLALARRGG